MELEGRVIAITGAASGIGRALAHAFARQPVRGVVVADLDAAGAEAVAEEIRKARGLDAMAVGCDVSDRARVEQFIDSAEVRFGQIDIFCANAGIAQWSPLDAGDDEYHRAFDVNVMGHVNAARRLIPGWVTRGEGYFLSTASAAGLLSQIGDVTYSISKHAAVGFAEWLSLTYGAQGVRVSCLCPMGVDTPLARDGLAREDERGLGARVVAAAGAILEPEDVADIVLEGIASERFLILPHPEVAEMYRRRAADTDRWLVGMQRLQSTVRDARGS